MLDIVGTTELIGDALDELLSGVGDGGESELVGAMQRAKLKQANPVKLQRLLLGIGLTTVAANAAAQVTTSPQVPAFKVERFISQSVSFLVSDIKVGTTSQMVGSGAVPIEVFARDAVGIGLKGDTANPGIDISIFATNQLAANNPLSGTYVGLAATV